jgi:type I restriction enzyme M protein
MKTQAAPAEVREFFKLLLDFNHKHHISRVFEDFLTVVTCIYAWQTKEEEYLETIKRYDRKELDMFCRMLAELVTLYGCRVTKDDWFDPLGLIYETIASNYHKSALGQFFTPDTVCDLMARLTTEETEKTQYFNDPCVGSGRMPLAASRANSNILVFGEDKDPICCKMAAINLMFHGVKAQIVNLDSLTLDSYIKGYLINWNFSKSMVYSCIDLPEEKSYTWQMWQGRLKKDEPIPQVVQMPINFFM